jgi:histidinol-phosphate/aromatic aminotransferase/cobyric acid decarboxylase-like protein
MNKAVMLCAGRGSRLGTLTNKKPKPLIEVNSLSIIENTVHHLINANYKELIIVIGYKGEQIIQKIKKYEDVIDIKYITNTVWDQTNNIYSLWLARHELESNSVTIIEGDIYFKEDLVRTLEGLNDSQNYILVSKLNNLLEGAYIEKGIDDYAVSFHSTKNREMNPVLNPLKTVNIYKLSADFNTYLVHILNEEINKGNINIYYEDCFIKANEEGWKFKAIEVSSNSWFEIDNAYDLSISEYKFSDSQEQHEILKTQHGGYWRYPMNDFALIYNFHFPPKDLKQKLKDRFEDIMLNYPSSTSNIEKYLGLFLEINPKKIVLANGVSEIIKKLPQMFPNKVVLPEPSFNEYANSFESENVVSCRLKEENEFEVDTNSIIRLIQNEEAQAVVLISPDNPSGKLISKEKIIEIYKHTEKQNTILIIDESFIDFSNKRESDTFLNDLDQFPRILLLKSMSKTFGIGGLRLGYAASSNNQLLEALRSLLPIWNINGFAEEFVLNLHQYKEEYLTSCEIVRKETNNLLLGLKKIKGLKVFDTESNFILCKIENSLLTANKLALMLLETDNIYIKECSGKSMQNSAYFFRVSSRTKEENERLLKALDLIITREFVLNRSTKYDQSFVR